MKKILIIIVSYFFVSVSFAQKAPSHQQWDKLLKKYVNGSGLVNYKGFKNDNAELNAYLKTLSDNAPQNNWSANEQKAYWINAYNAYTVSLIVSKYPVKSIKDIGGKIYKVNTPWDIKFINISGKKYDLNNIEHGIMVSPLMYPKVLIYIHIVHITGGKSIFVIVFSCYLTERFSTNRRNLCIAVQQFETLIPTKMQRIQQPVFIIGEPGIQFF